MEILSIKDSSNDALSHSGIILRQAISLRVGEIEGDNPWDAATLEWSVSSPPPAYNFARIPIVARSAR